MARLQRLPVTGARDTSCGKLRQTLIAGCGILALATPQYALAQQAPQSESPAAEAVSTPVEEVVIEGFRASLDDALRQKREAIGVADFVPLGDIGDLPTTNIADTLEFVPGVLGTRFRGTVEDISMRGLPALLTLSTVNGRELTSKSGTRGVGFRIWPSEFFTRAGVYKSAVASITEGGIAGTIDLSTPSPLNSKPGIRASARLQYSPYNEHHDFVTKKGARIDVLATQKFDLGGSELGIAFGFDHVDDPSVNAAATLGPFVELTIRGQRAIVPNGAAFSLGAETFRRDGLLGVVEWRSNSGFAAKLDAIYIDAFGESRTNFQQFAGLNAAARWPTATIVGGSIQTGTLTGISATSRGDYVPNQNYAYMLGGNFSYENDGWKAALDVYASRTTEHRTLDRVTLIATGVNATATFTPDMIAFSNFNKDLANPAIYGVNQYASSKLDVEDQAKGIRLSLDRKFDGSFVKRIGIGGRYMERQLESLTNIVLNNNVRNAALFPQFAVGKLSPNFFVTTPYLDFDVRESTGGVFPTPMPLLNFEYSIGAMPRSSFPITDGIPPEVLHRIASLASGGMDTLPHNGAIITLLAVTGLTHREAYKDIFAITVIKTMAAFVAIGVFYATGLV